MRTSRGFERLGVLALASLAVLASDARAQEDDDEGMSPWARLDVVHVDPTMVEEFTAVQRELSARAKEAGVPWRNVSRTEVFGDVYRFLIATPVESLASFDSKGSPDPAEIMLLNRLERCVTSRTSYALRLLPEVSNPLPEDEQAKLMVVNIARIFPGKEQEYLDVMAEDFFPHFDEAEMHHLTGALAFGGENGFLHVFFVEDFAELDQGSPVMRALGTDGAQVATAKLSGVVSGTESWVARFLPELSHTGEPAESEGR